MARRSAEKSDVTLSAWNKTKQHKVHNSRFDEGLTLETSAFKLFTVANLHYYPSWQYLITLLYPPTDAAPQFL